MPLSAKHETFLQLVRMGLGHQPSSHLHSEVDWNDMQALAYQHGLLAVVLDGIEKLPDNNRPSQIIVLNWIGEVLQNYEQRYYAYEKAIASLAGWHNQHGYKMMLLKGYACSRDWPKPEHRPCGDIDIWQFGKQKDADKALANTNFQNNTNIKIDTSHHHHTVFDWEGFMVENHYDFVNVYAHKSSRELEKIFKELGKDDTNYTEVLGERVYLPSPNLYALFLLKHMISHFAAAEISLRQVLDWAFFVEKHTSVIDWNWLDGLIEKYHMKDFYNSINAIVVGDLGFNVCIFPRVQFVPALKDRIFEDIMEPAYSSTEPKGLFKRLIYKFRRWQGNAWKQKICYGESRASAFLHGIRAHLLKPGL